MTEAEEEFIVVLPSNTKSSDTNTPSQFLTRFERPIELIHNGDWEVGLVELNFKNTIKTIDKDAIRIIKKVIDRPQRSFNFEFGTKIRIPVDGLKRDFVISYFKSPGSVSQLHDGHGYVNGLNSFEISDGTKIGPHELEEQLFDFTYDESQDRFIVNRHTDYFFTLTMPTDFMQSLGLLVNRNFNDHIMSWNDTTDNILQLTERTSIAPYAPYLYRSGLMKYLPLSASEVVFHRPSETHIINTDDSTFRYFLPTYIIDYESPIFKDVEIANIPLKTGYYSSFEALETELNSMNDLKVYMSFNFNSLVNRFEMTLTEKPFTYYVILDHGLNDVLGFKHIAFSSSTQLKYKGELQADLMRGISSLFIYCDCCQYIHVGDSMSPLLRCASFDSDKYGDQVIINYNTPVYIPVSKRWIDTIQIKICDASGSIIPLEDGLTTMILQFRRR